MPGNVPQHPKIYHIVHVDRLEAIINDEFLWCDAEVERRNSPGTVIGISSIKQRRMKQLKLQCHQNLFVGQCVPFYFCPRSVMLYLFHRGNHLDLTYQGGQDPIVHLEADLHQVVEWADQNRKRWAFTLSNAGSGYFEDRSDLNQLDEIDWQIISAKMWKNKQDKKQAEFLIEHSFPWELISKIGVKSQRVYSQVHQILQQAAYRPHSEIKPDWYY